MEHHARINEEGQTEIDDIIINESIFNEEKSEYILREREDFINTLIDWIGEAHDRPNDIYLMKQDLKMIINACGTYLFSSISTNKYVFPDEEEFNEICEELLNLNNKLRK